MLPSTSDQQVRALIAQLRADHDAELRRLRASIDRIKGGGNGITSTPGSNVLGDSTLVSGNLRVMGTVTADNSLVVSGTAFPASPATGSLYFRTDLGLLCYFDGTRWLTVTEYGLSFPRNGFSASSGLATLNMREDYKLFFTRATANVKIDTTLDASNYWSLLFRIFSEDWVTIDNIIWYSCNPANGWSLGVNKPFLTTINYISATVPTPSMVDCYLLKNGAPGLITAEASLFYRLVVT
jgi:hypothetical protein